MYDLVGVSQTKADISNSYLEEPIIIPFVVKTIAS